MLCAENAKGGGQRANVVTDSIEGSNQPSHHGFYSVVWASKIQAVVCQAVELLPESPRDGV